MWEGDYLLKVQWFRWEIFAMESSSIIVNLPK